MTKRRPTPVLAAGDRVSHTSAGFHVGGDGDVLAVSATTARVQWDRTGLIRDVPLDHLVLAVRKGGPTT